MRTPRLFTLIFSLSLLQQFSFADTAHLSPPDSLIERRNHIEVHDTIYILLSDSIITLLLDSDRVDSALNMAKISLALSDKLHYARGLAQSKFLLGKANIYKFNFESGKSFIRQALLLFDSLNDEKGIADCSLQLGVILFSIEKNYQSALNSFSAANKIYTSLGDKPDESKTAYLMGLCFTEIGNYKEAEQMLLYAMHEKEGFGNLDGVYECRNGLADLYFRTRDFEKSKDYYHQCLEYFKETKNTSGISQSLLGIGKVYSSTGRLDSAKNYLLAAYDESKKVPSNPVVQNSMQLLSSLILNQVDLLSEQIKKERNIRYLLLGSIILLIILVIMAYQRYRFKQSVNLQLTKMNNELTSTMSQLKRTQAQLLLSEKLASVGQLTAGVAHEINNPINFVTGNISPLKKNFEALKKLLHKLDDLENDSDLRTKLNEIQSLKKEIDFDYTMDESGKLLDGIEEGSRRTATIVKGLRQFSRMDEDVKKRANINEGIESTLVLLQNKLKFQNIELELSLGKIPDIPCYPGQLNQVFMNLFTNAADAIGTNGKIFITTSADHQSVKISVRDTGQGMSEEVKQRIFDPFFTTKEIGKGTGLGLSISYGIIEKHNGTIEVKSEPGQGTEFIITLPISA